ncbi:MAG: hypothetical protein FWF54_04535 [Candidatus Azobacteroides sp.]|jgi:peptidoglycan hydrolase CwlO-like protein|nr:hypothetical protein [Candidatus Azobacteroides sp.]
MELINAVLLTFGTSLATGFVTFIFSRRRNNIDNIDAATETWQKIVDKLEKQIEKLLIKVDHLETENNNLKDLINSLKDEIDLLKKMATLNETLELKIQHYETLLSDNHIAY